MELMCFSLLQQCEWKKLPEKRDGRIAHGIATLVWPLGQLELSSAGGKLRTERKWQSNHDDDSLWWVLKVFRRKLIFFSLSLFLSDSFYRTQFDHLSRLWSGWRWMNEQEAEGVSEHLKIITVRWRGFAAMGKNCWKWNEIGNLKVLMCVLVENWTWETRERTQCVFEASRG